MRSIPPITKNLLIICILCFLTQLVFEQRGTDLTQWFGLHFILASKFYPHQLLTYIFLHGSTTHLVCNMFALWMFGGIIERTLGARRFLSYFLLCGIGAGICQEIWQLAQYFWEGYYLYDGVNITGGSTISMDADLNYWTTIGASGSCYGVLLAFGVLYPNERIMLLIPPIPMKAKYFVVGYALIELLSAFYASSNIAHFAHLGGMFFGWALLIYWRNKSRRQQQSSSWNPFSGNQAKTVQKSQKSRWTWRRKPLTREQIIEKARRKGYDALTDEEKQQLFR